ncbi:hypothetical protein RJ639_004115 [Escallonia herrerae]|uniref:Kinesin motor domain-containing protein n=1 Tax=Escallonia herrerae TaxID=1293975 RepID=A0AA89AY92_9ASTE|nr:hypothetical protein RJ639_004115 [Escallonia herrerae]
MATRLQGPKARKSAGGRPANSPASSTTSSSKHVPDASVNGMSSPASSSARSKPQYFYSESVPVDGGERSKENVTVTVRFRPLSPREIRQGEEIAWYADGETIVRSEHNPSIAYAYDAMPVSGDLKGVRCEKIFETNQSIFRQSHVQENF